MQWKEYRQKILDTIDAEAYFLKKLETEGLRTSRTGSELKSQCPFKELHLSGQDSNPSFTVNLDSGVYFCNACGSKGNLHTFHMVTGNLTKQDAWYELGDALGIQRPSDVDSRPAIDPGLPSSWHRALLDSTGVIRDILKDKRGITNETLKRFLIGWDNDRVTIPIYNEYNELVNVRRYKWNSYEDSTKMINYVDQLGNAYGEDRIFGIEHLYDDRIEEVLWCEGEWDRLLAEQLGYYSCTSTAGANNFVPSWYNLLRRKKRIFICYDNDKAGREATDRMIANLRNDVELFIIKWPPNWRERGDLTDIFVEDKYTVEQFNALFEPLDTHEEAPLVQLASSSNAMYTGKRIRVPVLVAGKESAPYIFPQAVEARCTNTGEETRYCESCVLSRKPKVSLELNSSDAHLLKLINCADHTQQTILRQLLYIPGKCPYNSLDVTQYGNLETIHMIPKADTHFDFTSRQEYVARNGYLIGNNLPTNKRFTMIGYMHASPSDQKATYVFDQAIPEKDLLDDLEITEDLMELLSIFKVAEGQSVAEKFNEIHADLERNVTYIWERRAVAYAVDLTYHSALTFTFQEQMVKRGWAECLIIGDSGQAKTTLVERLMQHYRCGELLSGESARRTGLVYSLQQTGSKNWTLIWGAMPLNDGGLITVDELSGMAEDDLAKMSDVRSSGIARSTGVVTAETTSRTRIIFISNPRNGRQLKAENYGVTAILKLFGKAEDVRRLDFAIGVASGEVNPEAVNKAVSDMPSVPHKYTTEACRARVLWAWSRRPENIRFTDEAVARILQQATRMGQRYSSRIPLVEPADQRLKIARLAIAAAICVFSTEDGVNVIVNEEHVDFVVDYLNSIYTSRALSYDRFSADEFENSDTTTGAMIKLRNEFASLPLVNIEVIDAIKALYQLPYFNRNTLEDAMGVDRDELRYLMRFLISNSVVEKIGIDYRRTPLGLSFIEHMLTVPPTMDEIRDARARRYKQNEI